MSKNKIVILTSVILGVLVLTFSITYAIFNYQQISLNNGGVKPPIYN